MFEEDFNLTIIDISVCRRSSLFHIVQCTWWSRALPPESRRVKAEEETKTAALPAGLHRYTCDTPHQKYTNDLGHCNGAKTRYSNLFQRNKQTSKQRKGQNKTRL